MAEERSDIDSNSEAGAQTEQIKEQIEETRGQMGNTIDAIQDKLSFSNLSEQVSEHVSNAVESAKDAVYDATVGKAANLMKNIGSEISGSSIVQTAKSNPFPFILIGAGAGLLAYQGLAKGRSSHTPRIPVAGAKPHAVGITDKVSEVAGTAMDRISGAAGTAYTGAGDAVGQAYDKVGEFGSAVRGQYDTYIEENPLAVGAVALALGAAVGMAIPTTRYEGELMGNARQGLIDKAQDTASELVETTKDAVIEAGRNFTEQAKSFT